MSQRDAIRTLGNAHLYISVDSTNPAVREACHILHAAKMEALQQFQWVRPKHRHDYSDGDICSKCDMARP